MSRGVVAVPCEKRRAFPGCGLEIRQLPVGRRIEEAAQSRDFGIVDTQPAVTDQLPLRLHPPPELFDPEGLHENLDAGLVEVVAPAFEVVHPQYRFQIREQMLPRQKLAHHLADDGRSAETAPGQNFKAQVAAGAAHDMNTDIVDLRGRPILRGAGHRNLEFARQVREFGVEGGPLTDKLAPGPRILQLVWRHAREVVGGRIADAITARLNGMHLHVGKFRQNIGDLLELRPVVLDVLTRREMPVAAIVAARNASQSAQLLR